MELPRKPRKVLDFLHSVVWKSIVLEVNNKMQLSHSHNPKKKKKKTLTICLAVSRNMRKQPPITIVCHIHCKQMLQSYTNQYIPFNIILVLVIYDF